MISRRSIEAALPDICRYGRVVGMKQGVNTDRDAVKEVLTRGVEEVIVEKDLEQKLLSGKQLRVKLGIDPTSPNLHIGRAVALLKLRDFQELGHQVVFIVGDFTGRIGDTSDKESERPMLDEETIEANKKEYFAQVGKLIDLDTAEFRHNSEWLGKLTYQEIGEQADQFSVADFISRENIKKRLDAGKRVSLREVLYPLMQGYDSVAVEADVEVGGTDQKFNLLAGRTLQEHFGQTPQNIITNPLIDGLDGRKMSSSWGNTINLTTPPNDMYGKVMSMHDDAITKYFTLCTRVPLSEIAEIERELSSGQNPRDAKMRLAREVVALYHGTDAAHAAESSFIEMFQKGVVPEDVVEVAGGNDVAAALIAAGVVESKSELARLLKAGAVSDAKTGEKYDTVNGVQGVTLKVGKRRFVRIV